MRKVGKVTNDFLESFKISNSRLLSEPGHCHDMYFNIKSPQSSSSLSTTRRFLPRLGHHLQVIPEPYPILLRFQMEENHEASLTTKDKKKELMNQIILPMKKHLTKINSCLPWFMNPSMPLLTTHPLIFTKFCLSTEPTPEHLRHPISSPRPTPTFLSTN